MSSKDLKNDQGSFQTEVSESENLMMRPPDEDPGDPRDPPYYPPTGDQSSPIGWLDQADNGYVRGWSFDPDNPSASNAVHVYIGGPAGTGEGFGTVADRPRPDVNQAYGIDGDHEFLFEIPSRFADGQYYPVYAYGIDTGANAPRVLNGCPKYFVMNPPVPAVSLDQVSPIAGSVEGGLAVTLIGNGFQPGTTVYFGNTPAAEVTVESGEMIHATLPASSTAGSVTVSVFNPDGSNAAVQGGFTYLSTQAGQQAEVVGISPLSVLENTQTELTIRGRNLIEAYNSGVFALRGPSRCQITYLSTTTSHDPATGLDTIKVVADIQCTPALQPMERLAIQVLASTRPEAAGDGVVQTSKQMFTVLPRSVPVPLAYTSLVSQNQPNLVMVSGRNLDGYQLSLDNGAEVSLQNSSDNFVSGVVMLPLDYDDSTPLQLSVENSSGVKVNSFEMQVSPLPQSVRGQSDEYLALASQQDALSLGFTQVPGQSFIGPTENDSSVFSLNSIGFGGGFNWGNFEITIIDVTIILPIVNEVHLIPFFDGGGDSLDSPVLAEVGKIFRLRGTGLLVAYRFEVQIHIRVAVIIGIYYYVWFNGFFNEFPEYHWGIGTVVLGIRIDIEVLFFLSFLLALVKPNGQLQIIASANLTAGIDFSIDGNGRLKLDPEFSHAVRLSGINPLPNNLMPCGGKFQLLADNGQTSFADALGGYESYYFVREAGTCCVPWNFNMQLVRFSSTGQEEVVQEGFQTTYCLTAKESPVQYDVIITSVPPPVGIPPKLTMEINDTAILRALAVPVDASGNPTGAPGQDLRDLGYDVEFFLALPTDQVLNPPPLSAGQADAIQPGNNLIQAAVTSVRVLDDEPALAFWKNSIYGLRRNPTPDRKPKLIAGGLPVTVNPKAVNITVEPVLAYEEVRNGQTKLVAAPTFTNSFSTPTEMWEMERYEPFETQRKYFLAVKVNVPTGATLPANTELKFQINRARLLEGFKTGDLTSQVEYPLTIFRGNSNRYSVKPEDFFTGDLIVPSSAAPSTALNLTLTLPNGTIALGDLFKVTNGTASVQPNVVESNISGANKRLVPPGENVSGSNVLLKIPLSCSANNGVTVSFPKPTLNIVPRNDEIFEEYLRVFEQVQTILADTRVTYFKDFAKNLLDKLNTPLNQTLSVIENNLKIKGEELWKNACELVNPPSSSTPLLYLDDRPLYWARLQGIGAVRAYAKRNGLKIDNLPNTIKLNMFEYPSRGLDIDGGIKFPAASDGKRKAIVTGFDPFQLYFGLDTSSLPQHDVVETSNPSGLLALKFNGATVDGSVYVRTAVFPVRYADFNGQLIEKAISPSLSKVGMIITISQNGSANYYDLERWAARNRVDSSDNNNAKGVAMPANPAGAEYLESTLPLYQVIMGEEELEGPKGTAPFVIDQSYKSVSSARFRNERRSAVPPPTTPPTIDIGEFHPEPLKKDESGHIKALDKPIGISQEGSGGNYLSNEIFYRVALVRNAKKKTLASGHFHVPPTGYVPNASGVGDQLIKGTTKAIERLVKSSFRLAGPTSTTFAQTLVNTGTSPALKVNYGLASNGSVATASSADPNFPASAVINGDRTGSNMSAWISGVGLPQSLEVDFGQSRTINEINVFTIQDNYQNPVEPTLETTFTSTHANTSFDVQYWNGSAWVNIASVTGNNKVWRQFTFSPVSTAKIRVSVTGSGDNYAYLAEVEVLGDNITPPPPPSRINYASATSGGVATASSAGPGFPASTVIDGNRSGSNGSAWISGLGFPQWVEVDFNQSRTIDEINVITVQDDYQNPIEPTLETTFTSTHANTAFDVQYWNGSAWVNIASVTGNNKVWRQFTFSPVTTTKIRINVAGSGDNYAYLTEVEAFGNSIPAQHSTTAELIVTNDSDEPVEIVSIESASPFSVTLPAGAGTLPVVINAGASLTLSVKFTPTTTGLQTGVLTLRDVNGEPVLSVELSGEGVQN